MPSLQEVRHVYDTVVAQLPLRADRKFIIVEMVYFSRWYREATDEQRQAVHNFVENGQVGPWRPVQRSCRAAGRG